MEAIFRFGLVSDFMTTHWNSLARTGISFSGCLRNPFSSSALALMSKLTFPGFFVRATKKENSFPSRLNTRGSIMTF